MAKKKKKSIEEILANAEQFFERGNYPLALKGFEKVQKKLNSDDLSQKIAICRKEANAIKAKDLIKKARKLDKKGKNNEALQAFTKAYTLCGKEWIQLKIDQLKTELTRQNAVFEAKRAESAGDFKKAADLYGMAIVSENNADLPLKRATSLVMAEKYDEAVNIFKDLDVTTQGAVYNYGFALAQIGRYYDCCIIWQGLSSDNEEFIEQKKAVYTRFFSNVVFRLDQQKDIVGLYRDVDFLLKEADRYLDKNNIKSLKDIYEYCFSTYVEMLWQKEAFEEIWGLLDRFDNYCADTQTMPVMIALRAKTSFKLAEKDSRFLSYMIQYWVTAIYLEDIADRFSNDPHIKEKVQTKLIDSAKQLSKKYEDSIAGKSALILLKKEQESMQLLRGILNDATCQNQFVCSPAYAVRFGKSEEILGLLKKNKAAFKTQEQYLTTGGAYSKAGKGLYYIENKEIEKALAVIDELSNESKKDEFVNYVSKVIYFEYGLNCVKNGKNYNRFLDAAIELFDLAPIYEKTLVEKAKSIEETEELHHYEKVLAYIYNKRATAMIGQALSAIMIRRAIRLYNQSKMNDITLKNIARKALQINPANESARTTLVDTLKDLEIEEMDKALQKQKLNKASRIARETDYPEVRQAYFECVEMIFDHLKKSDLPNETMLFYLDELYSYSATVDRYHPLLDDMRYILYPENKGIGAI